MGGRFVVQVELVELLALPLGKPRIERLSARLHGGGDGPVFLRAEGLDLALAVNDKTQRDRLHAACRFRAGQLAPQHRRQVESDQIIKRAAGAIGVDQRSEEHTSALQSLMRISYA